MARRKDRDDWTMVRMSMPPTAQLFKEDSEFRECLLFGTDPEADPEARLSDCGGFLVTEALSMLQCGNRPRRTGSQTGSFFHFFNGILNKDNYALRIAGKQN
jgi:hypothetical protein